jgi:uncharacterized protein YutE (UPF0331/DUF86 family)
MIERITQKTGRIRENLHILHELQPDCEKRFNTDPVYRGALLHYLYVMADNCISLAEMVIKMNALRPPQVYYEAFDILAEGGVLEKEFAYEFAGIAGFRNFLAHDYEKVDALRICKDAMAKLSDVETYLQQIEKKLP